MNPNLSKTSHPARRILTKVEKVSDLVIYRADPKRVYHGRIVIIDGGAFVIEDDAKIYTSHQNRHLFELCQKAPLHILRGLLRFGLITQQVFDEYTSDRDITALQRKVEASEETLGYALSRFSATASPELLNTINKAREKAGMSTLSQFP